MVVDEELNRCVDDRLDVRELSNKFEALIIKDLDEVIGRCVVALRVIRVSIGKEFLALMMVGFKEVGENTVRLCLRIGVTRDEVTAGGLGTTVLGRLSRVS
jgi:hypothetical protein